MSNGVCVFVSILYFHDENTHKKKLTTMTDKAHELHRTLGNLSGICMCVQITVNFHAYLCGILKCHIVLVHESK